MKAFARHASHCSQCAHPYEVHKNGGSLCSKGHQRAIDVAQYVMQKAGKAYSVVDLDGNRRVQMEIPADCEAVRELLKAMERGLRLRRKTPVVSYDETYPVPPRVSSYPERDSRLREPRYISKPMLETSEAPPSLTRKASVREKSYYSGRGSLYESDMKERERRYKQQQRQSTYYSVGSRGALPVPAKDDYYY